MKKIINFRKLAFSFSFAFKGLLHTARLEQNFRFHLIAIIPAVIVSFYLSIGPVEWGLIIISIFFVLVSEMFNTALEKLCDEQSGGKKSGKIGIIKDISAGAVLLSALNALIIGVIFLAVPLVNKFLK